MAYIEYNKEIEYDLSCVLSNLRCPSVSYLVILLPPLKNFTMKTTLCVFLHQMIAGYI